MGFVIYSVGTAGYGSNPAKLPSLPRVTSNGACGGGAGGQAAFSLRSELLAYPRAFGLNKRENHLSEHSECGQFGGRQPGQKEQRSIARERGEMELRSQDPQCSFTPFWRCGFLSLTPPSAGRRSLF